MGDILSAFVEVAPYINKLTNTDFAVSVCDLEKCLIYVPSEKQDHKIRSGVPHVKGSVSYESVITGKRVIRRVGSDVFGFSYIAIAIPLKDEVGNIIGSVSFTEAVDKQDLMMALADNLHDTVQQLVSISDIISINSKKLKDVGTNLNLITDKSLNRVKDVEGIVGSIKTFSEKTDTLGLNAYMEATSLGQEGANFRELVDEIREIAHSTKDHAKNADNLIDELRLSTARISEKLDELLNIASHQIEINNYISKLSNDLNDRAEKLKENAKLLSEEEVKKNDYVELY